MLRKIKKIFGFNKKPLLPKELIEKIEDTLIEADASMSVIKELITPDLQKLEDSIAVKRAVEVKMLKILQPFEKQLSIDETKKPFVIFVSGVNGSGKTTTIAKLINKYIVQGKRVLVGACDTFRAAATEQLEHWVQILGADIERSVKEKEDPSAVLFRSFKRAEAENFDILIIDTSGRLQSNTSLMAELKKMQNVLKKLDPSKPDVSFLVIDGGAGQDAILQGKAFKETIEITGIIVTKLDSSSKGGTILTIANDLKFPIYMICMGEGVEDFADFNAQEFINNIFENDNV